MNRQLKIFFQNNVWYFVIIIIFLIILSIAQKSKIDPPPLVKNQTQQIQQSANISQVNVALTSTSSSGVYLPLPDALTRVTKKPFGIYVTPKNSPVTPEHFSGYHTGVDFETKPDEQNIDVAVYAICDGPLILKKTATGYGGVAVQACEINQKPVTVIYGHLRLASITTLPKTFLSHGQLIGLLGKGYSTETAGERKHLHLGIHQGTAVNLLGYVSKKTDLNQWLDFLTLKIES